MMIKKTNFQFSLSDVQKVIAILPDDDIVLNEPTGDFFYDPWTIKEEYKNSAFNKLISALPNIGQARLIKLESGESYYAHADIDDRYHMSIQGNHSYLIDLVNNIMYSVPIDGCWYHMDAGLIHTAGNFGEIYRFQIVVRNLLLHSVSSNLVHVTVKPNTVNNKLRYYLDNTLSSWLNKTNKKQMMDQFKVDISTCTLNFLLDKSLIEDLKNNVHQNFDVIIA